MLSWICPDCGCDCAPTDQECPDCSDLVQAGMVALAQAVQEQRDSFPRRPEIPLQERVPLPRPSITPRRPAVAAPRYIDPQAEQFLPGRTLLPATSLTVEKTPPPPPAPAPEIAPVPPPVVRTARKAVLPGWLISLMVATVLSLGGAAIIRNMETEHRAEAASSGVAQSATERTGDRNIEVTALRVLGANGSGSQLQYIVVNHSAAALSNVNLRIAVRSANSRISAPPLFTISALVPGLAPFASREMKTDIDDVRPADLPDWDRLRAEVQVGAP